MTAAENISVARAGIVLASADLPCSNGCGCEEYDYCAQDEAQKSLAALDALAADLAAADAALSVANETIAMLEDGVTECVGQRDALAARMATLTRELGALQVKFERHHGFLDAAEVCEAQLTEELTAAVAIFEVVTKVSADLLADTLAREAQLREALRFWVERADRFEEQLPANRQHLRARGVLHPCYAVGQAALVVQPPDTREPRSQYWSHWPVPDTREPEFGAGRGSDTKGAGCPDARPTSSPAGGAPGGVAKEGE